jgi:hypothetical protein
MYHLFIVAFWISCQYPVLKMHECQQNYTGAITCGNKQSTINQAKHQTSNGFDNASDKVFDILTSLS